ncbi:MAG: DUF1874 domain-containing protein [Acidobacteriota bacterium]
MMHLLNSAVMPQAGQYRLEAITTDEFGARLKSEPFVSYIGYPETAKILEALFGVEVPISREQTRLADGDTMLVARLKYRVAAPGQKGYVNPTAEDFEWLVCHYSAPQSADDGMEDCGICLHSSGQLDGQTCQYCGGTGRVPRGTPRP